VIRTETGALLVPQQAVTQLQTKYQVAIVNSDNTVDIRIVNPGERIGTHWIINEGLKPGDRVIVEGLQKVRQGMKVEPKPYAASQEIVAPVASSTNATR
jgi:membrane fusion protein (multidrug efflux system)